MVRMGMGLLLALCLPSVTAAEYPLLDGHCGEYPALQAVVHKVDRDVELYVFQDAGYVWLCYTVPPRSHGTLDLRISAPALEEPLNLHVSAQLGEWRAEHPEEAPHSPGSELWWNNRDWYANPVSLNGMRDTEAGRRPNFVWSHGRELQIAKSRFGRGEWQLVFDIGMLRSTDDAMASVRFPAEGHLALLSK